MAIRPSRLVVAAGAGFALADGAIVALALPELLSELDATVEGVAAVIGVYTAALALALPFAARFARSGSIAFLIFAAASAGCAAAQSLELLLALRAVQGAAAAGALVAAFPRLVREGSSGGGLWQAVTLLGLAVGPAIGGALTETLDWRAIFAVQVPVALAGALAVRGSYRSQPRAGKVRFRPVGPALALALVSAALSAVVFLLVLLLVTGWSFSPLKAAATVTVLPAATLATAWIRWGDPRTRAGIGCLLAAGGVGSLAFLAEASGWWTVAPQVLAGAGMGLALPTLAGELLPERTRGEASWLLAVRHAGIALGLLALAPLVAASLDSALARAQERGVAVILDAALGPTKKVELASAAFSGLDTNDPRGELAKALAAQSGSFEGEDLAAFERVRTRTDDTIVRAGGEAFAPAFGVAALLALVAAAACRPRRSVALLAAGVVVAGALAAQFVAVKLTAPKAVKIADPCQPRKSVDSGGVSGEVQKATLKALDRIACDQGASREELVLALVDDNRAQEYEAEHGSDPRKLTDLLSGIF